MPKWWPWGRSKHPDPEPAAPAIRPEPAWHRLPAVQRTVGDIEPTAQLQGFTAVADHFAEPRIHRPAAVTLRRTRRPVVGAGCGTRLRRRRGTPDQRSGGTDAPITDMGAEIADRGQRAHLGSELQRSSAADEITPAGDLSG